MLSNKTITNARKNELHLNKLDIGPNKNNARLLPIKIINIKSVQKLSANTSMDFNYVYSNDNENN